jgi:hypothetical protein
MLMALLEPFAKRRRLEGPSLHGTLRSVRAGCPPSLKIETTVIMIMISTIVRAPANYEP